MYNLSLLPTVIPGMSPRPCSRRALRRAALPLVVLLALAPVPAAAQRPAQPTGEPWRLVQPPQSSLVYARDGSLIGEIGRQWRTSVSIRTLPKYLAHAFVAVEDQRFYQHDGVDVVGIVGALKDAVMGDPRGASTITQQLVGNMHPDVIDRTDRSPARKLREQAAAREMEKRYTKEQILEAYLNQIHFGHGWYGVEAASRHYFGKGAAALSLAEAATLASLPKGPAIYDPIRYPDRARERRNTVLALMQQQDFITRAQMTAAQAEPVRTAPMRGMSADAPWFLDVVRVQAERAGVPVMNGGYRIHTTLDPELQRAAIVALVEGAAAVEARAGYRHATYARRPKGSTDYLQGMVVAMDPTTGDVRALVGGREYSEAPFNRAVNGVRQPGSAFKPFVYAAVIADSIPANEPVADTAIAIPLEDGTLYEPGNADREFQGPMTLRESLVRSRNTVAVQLAQQVTMDSVIAVARRAGLGTPIAPYPSSAIGASAVQPLDLVAAYSVFSNLGAPVEPRFLVRVEDGAGRTVHAARPSAPEIAMDPRVAFIVRDMLRDVVDRGTASAVRRYLPERVPAAGKTGTTNDNTDVWFVGMTPELVAGVWLGFDRPKTITAGAAGGTLAAPVWGRMMAAWYAGRDSRPWMAPAGVVAVELDRESGQPATADTPPERRYTEYFIEGTEPGARRFDPWRLFDLGPVTF